MNNALMVLLKALISVALFGACYWGVDHGSSAAFDLGLGAGFMALFHWIFWGNK
jgi:hypothetical protein